MQKIAKVKFDKVTMSETLTLVKKWLKEDQKRHIVTPNPEIVLKAQKNKKYLRILNNADLRIADGIGILWASRYLDSSKNTSSKILKFLKFLYSLTQIIISPKSIRTYLPERVTGTDLMQKITTETDSPIFLLGAGKGVAEKVKEKLKNANIVATHSGSPEVKHDQEIREKINKSGAEILFVAYGAPKQEFWINRNLKHLKSVKIAIGVGGAFDFIAGERKRAPKWMQKIGLEWLYRILQEPSRSKRIFNATVKFPYLIFKKS